MSSFTESGRPAGPLPAVDERLVASETRYEIADGRLAYVAPADEPHGTLHSKVLALVEAHVGEEYQVACDMLTRLTEIDDIAPDVSVFPRERDAATEGRQLEQLTFEIVSTQTLSNAALKAGKLLARGVRRAFAIDVQRERAFEWSKELGTWSLLAPQGEIVDAVFAVPVPVAALVSSAKVDDAVARALLTKRNPVLFAALDARRTAGRAEGRAEGKAEALLTVLRGRKLSSTEEQRERIAQANDAQLDRWLLRAVECRSVAELLEPAD